MIGRVTVVLYLYGRISRPPGSLLKSHVPSERLDMYLTIVDLSPETTVFVLLKLCGSAGCTFNSHRCVRAHGRVRGRCC